MPTLCLLADRTHGFLLDDAQQFDLHVQRQIRDFIEKQRAAFGGLNQSLLVADRAGEAAALVAEQLAFHELGGNRPAIDRHERAVAPRPGLVNEFRHQFLARAGLAENMYRRLAARDARDHLAQMLHGGRRAEQAGAEYAGVGLVGVRQLDGGGDQFAQTREIERLGDEIEGAQLERAHRSFHVAMRGDHRDGYARRVLLNPLDEIQAVAVGELHVGQAQIEPLRLEHALRRGDAVRGARTQDPCARA